MRVAEQLATLIFLADLSKCVSLSAHALVEVARLAALQNLSLSRCRRLAALPKEIGRLRQLKKLNLSTSLELANLPEEIGNLRELQQLNLSRCRSLAALPPGMCGLMTAHSCLQCRNHLLGFRRCMYW